MNQSAYESENFTKTAILVVFVLILLFIIMLYAPWLIFKEKLHGKPEAEFIQREQDWFANSDSWPWKEAESVVYDYRKPTYGRRFSKADPHFEFVKDPHFEFVKDPKIIDSTKKTTKESYGEPPGMVRSGPTHNEMDEWGVRGWANMPVQNEANTASSISHQIEWSA